MVQIKAMSVRCKIGGPRMFDFKIFGERNTATNALKLLIEKNSASRCCPSIAAEIDPSIKWRSAALSPFSRSMAEHAIDIVFKRSPDIFAWKHCATRFSDPLAFSNLQVFFLIRHPASWLLSLYREPYHALSRLPDHLSDFISMSWRTVDRDRLGGAEFGPLELYAEKVRSYDAFAGELRAAGIGFAYLRFEDVVTRQREVFVEIAPRLKSPAIEVACIERSTKDRRLTRSDYVRRYSADEWRDELSGVESEINRRVDWPLLERFGYGPL